MSRYVVDLGEDKEFVYGWDHALGYFYELWDNSLGEEDYERVVEDKSYALSKLGRGEMMEKMEQYGANRDHILMMAADLPF
jgi:hypothetical protein